MLELNQLYNMDCLEAMKQFPDKYFELAIVDPPYGISAGTMTMGSGKHKFSKDKVWDSSIPDKQYFDELFRVSQNQIIWGGNYFTEYLPPSNDWIIWDKMNPNLSFSEAELAWCSIKRNVRIVKHYSAQVEDGGKIHPTQKAVKLYTWLLSHYAKQGDKILDTHVGSASSLIACYDMGFDYIGFEIDKDYYNMAQKRIEENKAQIRMVI
jgi:site-specific DNA-methyltransferase (adenine-specific)